MHETTTTDQKGFTMATTHRATVPLGTFVDDTGCGCARCAVFHPDRSDGTVERPSWDCGALPAWTPAYRPDRTGARFAATEQEHRVLAELLSGGN